VGYTKSELVSQALGQLGIADYEFDITPEEIDTGVKRMDAMIATWSDENVFLSYTMGGEASEPSGVPDVAVEAVVMNLAIRLAPSYGKQVSPEVATLAKSSLNSLRRFSTAPRQRQMPQMPRGAGYKVYDRPFTQEPKKEYLEDVDDSVDTSGGPDGS
jgi:hypothetical protein